jgi:signal transduction histidine kinase
MTKSRLTLLLVLFFLALALPTSILVYQAYGQLKWEAFYQHQRLARELTLRIDSGFRDVIAREENRPISDYEFLNVSGEGQTAFLQRSPLSQFPAESDLPGLLGYFQVDAAGRLRTPIVPETNASAYGISATELDERAQQAGRIRGILGENRLVGKGDVSGRIAPAAAAGGRADETVIATEALEERSLLESEADSPATQRILNNFTIEQLAASDLDSSAQSGFDDLSSRRKASTTSRAPVDQVKDLKLEDSYQVAAEAQAAAQAAAEPGLASKQAESKRLRKEKVNLPQALQSLPMQSQPMASEESPAAAEPAAGESLLRQQNIRIETFESEVEPMEFALLDSGHFVLFRRVWHRDQRYVQGVLIEQASFIDGLITTAFGESSLSSMSELIVAYRGAILRQYAADYSRLYRPSGEQENSDLLYQGRLIAPFGDLELIYTLARLPVGAGGQVIIWSALVLFVVLVGGCLMLLRLGQRQLALARQQQDFVSAVSHELKTPLTSIRMYGEMLREGWVDEAKRKTYYDFIFHEAERLTRLINNVLQLARLSHNEQAASISAVTVGDALAELKPRLTSQLEPSGFSLNIDGDDGVLAVPIQIDVDWFIQIFINLVDNAVKFSANAENRSVDIRYRQLQDGRVQFSVRDHGPGIEADQMKKIFTLFYRSENELTRETIGTGIGLALVHQLASAMRAEVDVVNCDVVNGDMIDSDSGAEFRIRFPTTR